MLLIAQLAIGSAAILARLGLGDGLGPITLSAWRLGIAAVVLVAFTGFRSLRAAPIEPISRKDATLLLAAGVLLGLHFVAWFASLERIPVARSTLLVTTSPVFTGLIAVLWLHHRIPGRFWWGLAVAGIGVAGITWPGVPHGLTGSEASPLAGDLLALGGAAAIAIYLLIAQSVQPRVGSARLVTWTYTGAALVLWPAALIAERDQLIPRGLSGWGSIVGMAVIPQLIGHTSLNWSLQHFSAGAVGAATLLEPIFAALLAWWLFGETVTLVQALGAAVVLLGVGLAISARTPASGDRPRGPGDARQEALAGPQRS